ncbi:MAG: sigma-70 family RNA polymerase sigma factor [Cyanobacteriota bacterium]|nr:sigma-70 family RNA polymerase sigma factor [Cyanobacteriota bacterium]
MNLHTSHLPRPLPVRIARGRAASPALQRRNALVESHRHLVPPVALHYWQRCPEPQDDLIQVGLLGLIRAAELFQPTRQTPFAAFARPHIRGAILHYLRDAALPVRLPRRQAELQSRARRLSEQRLSGAGPAPRAGSEVEGITDEQWLLLERHRQLCRPTPLEPELLEHLPTPPPEIEEDSPDGQARVEALLAGLEPRSRQVVRWVVLQGWSLRKAAAALGVSTMTAHRCLHSGLQALRLQLREPPRPVEASRGLNPGKRLGRAPSGAQGWPSRHSPPPAGAPVHRAKR